MINLIFAFRQLKRSPVVTTLGILTLALGIGASTAIFSLVDGVFLSPLNFPDANGLVLLCTRRPDRTVLNPTCSVPRFQHYRREQTVFTDILASVGDAMALTGNGDPEQVFGERVTANYFDLLGVKPIRGRLFTSGEEKPGDSTVVVSESFWNRRLGANPNVIGRVVTLNGVSYTIIGVVPTLPTAWTRSAELWTTWPFRLRGVAQAEVEGGLTYLNVTGRLKPGVSLKEAQASMDQIAANYTRSYPSNSDSKRLAVLRNLVAEITDDLRPAFLVLSCAALCILLIACVNVANLLLTRFTDREREIAVRTAVGATRADVLRLLLSESLLFSAIAGVCGLLFAHVFLKILPAVAGNLLPVDGHLSLHMTAFFFAIGLSLLLGFAVGVFPAWQGTRQNVLSGLKEGGRSATVGRAAKRFRSSLLAGQVAIALTLLVGAGLLLRTFSKLQHQDLGFRRERLFMAAIDLPSTRYPDGLARDRFAQSLLAELDHGSVVEKAAIAMAAPFTPNRVSRPFARADGTAKPPAERPAIYLRSCTPGYFQLMGIPLLAGRDFNERDTPESNKVAVISQAVAKRFFPGEDPVGQKVFVGSEKGTGISTEIVGLVGSVHSVSLRKEEDEFYLPWSQSNIAYVQILARTRGRAEGASADVRAAIVRLDPQLPIMRQTTMEDAIAESLGQNRLLTSLVGMFAGLAFLLATVGIYSVVAYTVAQRTGEIGIRMAFGATKSDVLGLIVRQGMMPVLLGAVLGIALTVASKQLLESQLFGVSPFDPVVLGASALALCVAALVACWFPALRATKVDPQVALRTT